MVNLLSLQSFSHFSHLLPRFSLCLRLACSLLRDNIHHLIFWTCMASQPRHRCLAIWKYSFKLMMYSSQWAKPPTLLIVYLTTVLHSKSTLFTSCLSLVNLLLLVRITAYEPHLNERQIARPPFKREPSSAHPSYLKRQAQIASRVQLSGNSLYSFSMIHLWKLSIYFSGLVTIPFVHLTCGWWYHAASRVLYGGTAGG